MTNNKSEKSVNRRGFILKSLHAVAGFSWFGLRAVRAQSGRKQQNPFEYDIERFKKVDANLIHYKEVKRISAEMKTVTGVAVGPDDRVYVSGDDALRVFKSDGTPQSAISLGNAAYCLSVDKNQDLYLGMGDHIEVYDQSGVRKARWESLGGDAIVTSIALSTDHVYVADAGNEIIWKFDKSGNRMQRIGEKNEAKDIPGFRIPSPYFDVAIDPDGFLWAANTGRHSLENYYLDGGFRTSWGEYSMEIEGFCGCCNPSHFTILEDGSFVTAEKGIPRVKVYNRIAELVSVVATPDQFAEGTVGLDLAVDSSQRIYVLDPAQKVVRIFDKKQKNI